MALCLLITIGICYINMSVRLFQGSCIKRILVARNKGVVALFVEVLFITGGQSVTEMPSSFPHSQHKRSFMVRQFSGQVWMDFHSHTTTIFEHYLPTVLFITASTHTAGEGLCVDGRLIGTNWKMLFWFGEFSALSTRLAPPRFLLLHL